MSEKNLLEQIKEKAGEKYNQVIDKIGEKTSWWSYPPEQVELILASVPTVFPEFRHRIKRNKYEGKEEYTKEQIQRAGEIANLSPLWWEEIWRIIERGGFAVSSLEGKIGDRELLTDDWISNWPW